MSPHATKDSLLETDPAIYDVHHQTWAAVPLPQNEVEWVERAAQVARVLAEDAALRDREQKIPVAEISLLKSSGLLKVLGPVKYGGGAQGWDVAYKTIREVAKGDGVKIDHVEVPWTDALGWNPKEKKPLESVLGIPWASLLLPTIQLVFSNFYIGIALGALDFALKYSAKNTRAWPYGGDNKDQASDEFYILERYGNFKAHLRAAETLADKAGLVIAEIYDTKSEKRDISARERGEAAEWVASVKIVATDTGLRVTSGVFEVTGARATSTKVGLDRFFRDIRTHTLHDPVSYKNRELGRFALLDEVPEPTWYT
ncbi:hypothetical protein LTR84_003599 [Exophiala bonariae]|uniref:Acyl-CoA dehydrogenase C-terminal domain-containing protein n=1 Tax=Exophiala bonariae TaxID=1690606 RepID=A0AAV9N8C1_9EURO|nr:hypothetical protein LTR84_003599 [Exophiala bonariae]